MAAKGDILDGRKPGADLILDGYRYARRNSNKNGTVPGRCLCSKCLATVTTTSDVTLVRRSKDHIHSSDGTVVRRGKDHIHSSDGTVVRRGKDHIHSSDGTVVRRGKDYIHSSSMVPGTSAKVMGHQLR